jgi:hypothetical protein
MATSFPDLSLSDSGGEGFGSLLSDGELGYSSSLDDLTETPLQGSPVSLDPSSASGDISIADQPTGYDSMSLSGIADAPPDPLNDIVLSNLDDSQIGGSNGAGTADSQAQHPATITSAHDTTTFLAGLSKYGSVLGSLFGKGAASTQPVVRGPLPNQNPNRPQVSAPVSFNLTLVIVVVVAVLVFVISAGGKT